nr:bifunctional lysylphosphatidylglycerol flippase/synthetase MprF [Priestia taiwanensis]
MVKILFPIAILTFVFMQGKKELSGLSLKESLEAIKLMPAGGFTLTIVLGAIAVSTMFFYDYLLIKSLNLRVSVGKIFRVSWTANSLNGIVGFGGLAGAGIRTMLYKEHIDDTKQLVKGIAWMTPSMLSGLSLLAFFVLIDVFSAKELLAEKQWLWIALIGVFLFLPVYLISSKHKGKETASATLTFKYTLVSVIEWLSAASVAHAILILLGSDIPASSVYGIFILSAIAGLISLVPGGFGTFDLTFILGFKYVGVQEEIVLTALLLYRIVYYFIPFILGLIFAIFEFGGNAIKKIEDKPIIGPALETTSVIWAVQRNFLSSLAYWALATLVFLTGLVQFILSIFPPDEGDFALFTQLIPPSVAYIANGLLFGTSLILLMSVTIYNRTKRTYWIVCGALVVGIIGNILKGFEIEETLWYAVMLSIFYFSSHLFTRIRKRVTAIGTLVRVGLLYYLVYSYFVLGLSTALLVNTEERFMTYTPSEFHLIFWTGIIFFILYYVGTVVLFEMKQKEQFGVSMTNEQLKDFFHTYGGNFLSHLVFLEDKQFFLSSDKKVLIQFARSGKKIIVLGDPAGEKESFREALQEFYDRADLFGYDIIFYQVDAELMPLYHDFGNNFFKLGEEAIVDLTTFTISGKKRAGMRATKNRFEREGYSFDIIHPPFSPEFLTELKDVSDKWLGKKNEKGFSLGYFDEAYLSHAPIAILRNTEQNIVSFMNIMPVYKEGVLSVDLMRHYPDAPSGIMDAMFINLFEWAKGEGYTTFNIGMAPLSNVGQSVTSFWSERVAGEVFNNIRYMYSFNGLRKFKDKYDPTWEARYLAHRKNRSLPATMIEVSRLIGKGMPKKK